MSDKKHDLKPCPFCGGAGEIYPSVIGGFTYQAFVACYDCGCKSPASHYEAKIFMPEHVVKAVENWNNRFCERDNEALKLFISSQEAENAKAYEYAVRLLVSMVKRHYPENKRFEPLVDLLGVLTQIDNAYTGVSNLNAELKSQIERLKNCMNCKHGNSAGKCTIEPIELWVECVKSKAYKNWAAKEPKP